MPRWGPQPTRHYKTTTTRRGNVTYRTVQRRGSWGGPYGPGKPPSKAEAKFFRWFFGLLLVAAVVFWRFYRLHGSAEAIVGPIWVVGVVAIAVLVIKHRSKSKKARIGAASKPSLAESRAGPTASIKPTQQPSPASRPAIPAPSVAAQASELQSRMDRLTREVEDAKAQLQQLRAQQPTQPADQGVD